MRIGTSEKCLGVRISKLMPSQKGSLLNSERSFCNILYCLNIETFVSEDSVNSARGNREVILERSSRLIQADCGVPLPALVVLLGVVDVEMETAAFATLEGAGDDQLGNSGQISQFDEIAV